MVRTAIATLFLLAASNAFGAESNEVRCYIVKNNGNLAQIEIADSSKQVVDQAMGARTIKIRNLYADGSRDEVALAGRFLCAEREK